jgi:glycerate kinase
MKVVVAMDSFKGSIASNESFRFVKSGILAVYQDAKVDMATIADGGGGFLKAMSTNLDIVERSVEVMGPLGQPVVARYGISLETNTAIVEIAQVAGISLIPQDKLNPLYTTTFGVGEIINDAIAQGCRKFVIGVGDSGTIDGGVGMLQALGYQFGDKKGKLLGLGGLILEDIDKIDHALINPQLKECEFVVACDVDNPLFGPRGAAHVYGPQKGATPDIVKKLDSGLVNLSNLSKIKFGKTMATMPGAGAAGGLGYAMLVFLNATLKPGVQIVGEANSLENLIRDCDVVVTGEGRIDSQTVQGKAPFGVTKLAKKYNKLVIAIAGEVDNDIKACNEAGIDAIFCVQRGPISQQQSMDNMTVGNNIKATTTQIFGLIKSLWSTVSVD